jgi:hypothetical protein
MSNSGLLLPSSILLNIRCPVRAPPANPAHARTHDRLAQNGALL